MDAASHARAILGILISQCAFAASLQTLYVYGDSISDTGVTYQITNGAWPPSENDQKYLNGDVWVEYAGRTVGYQLVSSARGGATTNNSVVQGYVGSSVLQWPVFVASDQTEVQMTAFRRESPPFQPESPDRTGDVHLVCVGSNDIFSKAKFTWEGMMNPSVDAITNTARYLLDNDNVHDVKVCDMSNMYTVPYAQAQGSLVVNFLKRIISYVSEETKNRVRELQLAYPDKSVTFIPFKDTMDSVTQKFKNQTGSCLDLLQGADIITQCTDVNDYMWWDTFHPTTLAHERIAEILNSILLG
ncbi:hypothetical protein SARC_06155 [Sphaeroforma arctica JP610]|uniref:SGNH hydrolase-type esterase domain-containing protein n=1 Tax=Sphaeroforma arctica JP610 TaxID=667725 RepID=A0A0L0FZY4_9EUKA|nr:hypothetical protein SARC_06155 [Sphaeroforma arctica JP610]KNC81528.1 hypothetical protein SARC_06155 [Sphaeroforma arctica JP610]|eukprot:XP_014155430.1 hypothetical protein SARC_06155 [Sphaeroforma arctica JP610]